MITWTDIFAGAGGSSQGAISVPGVVVRIAANHSQLAVDVHQLNHQQTDHACVDLHLEDPRNFPRTDALWASPECTKWSIANSKAKALSAEMGGDLTLFDDVPDDLVSGDEDEITRSRLLMFDVLRFVEHHRYRAVVVENVVDIATQAKYARAWQAWQRGLRRLGYEFRVVSMNSMHAQAYGAPAPQSRDRLYVIAWPEKEKAPDIDAIQRPRAYCQRCDKIIESRQAWKNGRTVGRYRAQYIYVCSHCGDAVEPGWLPASSAIDWSIEGQRLGDKPIKKFVDTKSGEVSYGPLSPKTMARIREGLRRYGHQFLTEHRHEYRVRDLGLPINTLMAEGNHFGLVMEAAGNTYDAADPNHPRHGDPNSYYRIWPSGDPLRTLHTSESKALLVPTEGRDGKQARPDGQPFRTQTTRNELGVLVPSGGTWHETPYPTSDPYRTFTTRENHGILTMLRGTNAPKPTSEPLDTMAASGNHHGLLVPYYSSADTGKPTSEPIGTLTTRDRYALIMRNNTGGAEMTTPTSEPFRTFTTTGHQSVIDYGPTRPVEAGVTDYGPVTREDIFLGRWERHEPKPIPTRQRESNGIPDEPPIAPEDCTFRMLEPHEIAAGMSFPADYQWQGTKRERVRLAGNAVCPPNARDIVWAVVESILGEVAA